jgi:hypothetical protein
MFGTGLIFFYRTIQTQPYTKYDGPTFEPKDFGMGYKALEAVLDNSRVEYDKLIEENIISGEYNTYLTNKRLLFYKPNRGDYEDKGIFCRIPFESIVGIDHSLEYASIKVYVKPLVGKIGEITVTFTFDQPDDYNELLKWVDTIKSGSMSRRANLLNASYFEPKVKKSFRDPILVLCQQYNVVKYMLPYAYSFLGIEDEEVYRDPHS